MLGTNNPEEECSQENLIDSLTYLVLSSEYACSYHPSIEAIL